MDLKTMTMEELVAHYNELAATYGAEPAEEFASLAKARAAINKLVKANKPKAESKRGPRSGIGAFVKEQLLGGMTNKEALEAAKAAFPANNPTAGTIGYYRNALVKAGLLPSTRKAA